MSPGFPHLNLSRTVSYVMSLSKRCMPEHLALFKMCSLEKFLLENKHNLERVSYGSVKYPVLIAHFCIDAALYFIKIIFNILQSALS